MLVYLGGRLRGDDGEVKPLGAIQLLPGSTPAEPLS
jgi:hypothetical protein